MYISLQEVIGSNPRVFTQVADKLKDSGDERFTLGLETTCIRQGSWSRLSQQAMDLDQITKQTRETPAVLSSAGTFPCTAKNPWLI